MIRRSTKLKVIVAVIALAVLTTAGVTYALVGETIMKDTDKDTQSTIVTTQTRPTVYTTEDSFARYYQTVQNGNSLIDAEHVHDVPVIDWNEQAIVAVPFSILSSQSFQSVAIEAIDSKKTIIVTVLDSPKGCMVTQDNKEHVAFIPVSQADAADPLSINLRIQSNDIGCNN